jgi:hypothetical protein
MYFIHYQGQNRGPYAPDQIRSMWASGIITADAVYWADSVWRPISELLAREHSERPITPETASATRQTVSVPVPVVQQRAMNELNPTSGPKGVGGWLLFFCVALTILAPIAEIFSMFLGWAWAESSFHQYPMLRIGLIWESLCGTAFVIYGFVVGCKVWSGDPDGRRIAKRFLRLRLFGGIGYELFAVFVLMGGLPKAMIAGGITGAVQFMTRELIFFLIWFNYFKFSNRVRNTYGDDMSGLGVAARQSRAGETTFMLFVYGTTLVICGLCSLFCILPSPWHRLHSARKKRSARALALL